MDADALLAATYRGDTRAFEALVRSQAGRLHRIASRVTGDRALADDVLQEAFLRILRVPAAARPSRAAASWLARVTVRVALNLLEGERARRRREERYATERSRDMKDAAPGQAALPEELDRRVAAALESLSPATRAALWLHVVEGEGVREVATCLDSSRSAVSRRIQAGLESLRARLAPGGAGAAGIAALRGALRGSDAAPAEALVQGILAAGAAALAAPTSASRPDALDAALAAPLRSLRFPTGIGVAAMVTLAIAAVAGGLIYLRSAPDSRPQPGGPVVAVPVAPPAPAARSASGDTKPAEPVAPTPAVPAAAVSGTIRDEDDAPIAGADVYLALTPARDEDLLISLGSFFRADYFQRSRFLATKTDAEGRYRFDGIRDFGEARLGAFLEGRADPRTPGAQGLKGVKLDEGVTLADTDMVLAAGKTLTARLRSADGAPVADAVVSVTTAWSATDHIFWPSGLSPSDAAGRFRLGFEARAAGCHLRVCSKRYGQAFFLEVPITEEPAELTLEEPARVAGTITWSDGTAAAGLTIRVNGRLPEPPIPIERMGLRAHVVHDGKVGEDGTYAIEGLHPRLTYDIFTLDLAAGERSALNHPLTPPMTDTFRPDPGSVKEWDRSVSRPVTIRGRIRTEATGRPVPEAMVSVRKDGKPLALSSNWADPEGRFEVRLSTGPGEYRIHAEPPVGTASADGAASLIDEKLGKTLHLAKGQDVDVELAIFEPVVFPLRVLDAAGVPLRSVQAVLHATLPGGGKVGLDTALALDAAGKAAFSLYYPVAELWCELSAVAGGPIVETPRRPGSPGTLLEESTIVLPRTCDVTALLLDPSGAPCARRWVSLRVSYEDGSKAQLSSRTDDEGKLDEKGRVRAAPFVLELRSQTSTVLWTSGQLDGSAGRTLDLGKVVVPREDA